MNCIIIEDQPPAQRILKKYIQDIETLDLKATFTDAIQALEYLKSTKIDLIFLDVHLPKISGMDFLRTIPNPPHIILTTAFPDYALESYEFNVVDYLLKPFSFQRFVKAVAKIPTTAQFEKSNNNEEVFQKIPNEIFIKSGYEHIKVVVDDILFIKSDADYTEINTKNKKHLSTESLRYWIENLSVESFFRVHKSFVINVSKITRVATNQIYLQEEIVVPLGRAYKGTFTERFLK